LCRDTNHWRLVRGQIRQIDKARLKRLKQASNTLANIKIYLLACVVGIGIDAADVPVQENFSGQIYAIGAPWRATRVSSA
jgi:transposase